MNSHTPSIFSNKRLIIGGAIAVLLIAMVFLQLRSPDAIEHERSAPLVLTSDDGVASLNIPDGALPDGVSVGDISMKIVSSTAISDDGLDRIVIALEPDGTQLRAPATLTFALDPLAAGEPLQLPLVLHLSGVDSIEAIDEVTISFDEETGEGTLSVVIEHFSLISYERALALFTVSVAPTSGSFAVGETFNRTLSVTPRTGSYIVTDIPWGKDRENRTRFMEATYGIANGTRWKLENRTYDMLVDEEDVLSPKMYDLVEKDMAATEAYRHDYAFTCIGEGTSDVLDRGAFIVSFTLQRETKWRDRPKADFEREARFVIKNPNVPFGEEYTCAKPPSPDLAVPEFNPTIEVCGGFTGVECP